MTVAFLCENIVEFPITIILQLIFTAITWFLFGLVPTFEKFIIAFLILELVAICAMSLGYMMSAASDDINIILTVVPALIMPLMIFGGLFIQADSIPVYLDWLKYLSWIFYAYSALMNNQWEGVELKCELCNGTVFEYEDCPNNLQSSGDNIIRANGFDSMDMWASIGYMVVLSFGYRFVAYLILLWKFREANR